MLILCLNLKSYNKTVVGKYSFVTKEVTFFLLISPFILIYSWNLDVTMSQIGPVIFCVISVTEFCVFLKQI